MFPISRQLVNQNCRLCGSKDPVSLHSLTHLGTISHMCTACVLKEHPGRFCPICFDVLEQLDAVENSNNSRVMCIRCPSVAHLACTGSAVTDFLCPRCSDPSFSFFCFGPPDQGMLSMTRELAKQLVCAAKISNESIKKAAVAARANAEKKVEEAVEARRSAKEAVDRVEYLKDREQSENASDD